MSSTRWPYGGSGTACAREGDTPGTRSDMSEPPRTTVTPHCTRRTERSPRTPSCPSRPRTLATANSLLLVMTATSIYGPPTMRTHGEVAQREQTDHALTHRGHTPLGAAHATAYVHARDLTATATNRRALRARDGHTPVQRRLRVGKERLSGVAVLPQPCLLCGGAVETRVHMHVGCARSRLLRPHY